MPRKEGEGAPLHGGEILSDETRREVFGGTGAEQGPGKIDKDDESEQGERHYSGASESGSGKRAGQVKKSVD